MKKKKILKLLETLRNSSDRIHQTFIEGSCARMFKILSIIDPSAELFWSDGDSHAVTRIKGVYYDIGGEVSKTYVKSREYRKVPKKHHKGYLIMKYCEVEDIKNRVIVEKYFK